MRSFNAIVEEFIEFVHADFGKFKKEALPDHKIKVSKSKDGSCHGRHILLNKMKRTFLVYLCILSDILKCCHSRKVQN